MVNTFKVPISGGGVNQIPDHIVATENPLQQQGPLGMRFQGISRTKPKNDLASEGLPECMFNFFGPFLKNGIA